MITWLRKLYQPEYMVKDELKLGEIPRTGIAYHLVLATAWAAVLETFLMAIIAMSDILMVSTIGEAAIAAVGITTQPRYLAQTVVIALNAAVTSICARRKGANDRDGAVDCLKQSLVLSIALSLIITAIFYPLAEHFIRFMGAEEDVVSVATSYLRITLLGLPLGNLCHTISSAQRGIGETKASMKINLTSSLVNIVFNYMFINGALFFPKLGVDGAAVGTVIGWTVGTIVAFASIIPQDRFLTIGDKEVGSWKFKKETLTSISQISSGSLLEQVCLRLGFMSYAKIITGLGTIMFAAHEILMNLMSLSFSFGDGFGIAASSLVGQNLGAKRSDLSIVYGKICQRMSLISSFILFLVFTFFGIDLVSLFSKVPEILEVSRTILVIIGVIIFAQASQMVFMGALRGAGDTKYTAIISMISIMIVRPIIGYIFAYTFGFGLVGAWTGVVIDQIIRLYLTHRRFSSGKWTKILV